MNKRFTSVALPLIASVIWGSAFVAQRMCAGIMTPFWINTLRNIIAAAVLGMLCLWRALRKGVSPGPKKDVIAGSLLCGLTMCGAMNMQQFGLIDTSSGKTGFITALYMVLVPVFSVVIGQKIGRRVWAAVALSAAGLYFLCVNGGFTVAFSDLILIGCAILYAVQILYIDKYTRTVDGYVLSCGEFLVAAAGSLVMALIFEAPPQAAGLAECIRPLLYLAVVSNGIAYTMEVISLRDGDPTLVTLLFSLESVFSAVAGAVILHERLTGRELAGCALMFAGVVLSQLPDRLPRGRRQTSGQ